MIHQTLLRRRAFACPAALLALAATAGAAPPAVHRAPTAPNPPLTFERNTGRYPKEVRFVARGGGGALFLTSREMVLSLSNGRKASALRLKLQGSNPRAVASGLDKQPGIVNYLIGNDPRKWRTNVPTYSRVKVAGVYPGVDLVTYGAGKSRTLEYDFVVKPGADASRIRMSVSGAKSLRTVGGKLIASTDCGDVSLNRPYAYQTLNGVRKQVACSFLLERNTVAFQIARYDASRPLVVDPTLTYSTLIGGTTRDSGYDVAVDAAGCAYVYGGTQCLDFPTTPGALKATPDAAQNYDGFLAKFNADGSALVYSTYIGGADSDYASDVAVDAAGCAFVTGTTYSDDLPTSADAYDKVRSNQDGFVMKLNATGSALLYGTLLGGTSVDGPTGLAVDAAGCAYVASWTLSTDFPVTPGSIPSKAVLTNVVGCVTKLNPAGTALVYSTYLGADASDSMADLAIDGAGCAYVVGITDAVNLPTTPGCFQPSLGGDWDGFVAKLNASGTALVYETYLGGIGYEEPYAVAVDSAGCAVITGACEAGDYPTTPGAYMPAASNGCVVTKLNAAGSALVYSTYLGSGNGNETGESVALGPDGSAYVVGNAGNGFPVTPDAFLATRPGNGDGFLSVLSPNGSALTYSTYVGGPNDDAAYGVAFNGGAVYVTGATDKDPPVIDDKAGKGLIRPLSPTPTFPVTPGAYQTVNAGSRDAFLMKFAVSTGDPTTVAVDNLNVTELTRISLRGRLTDAAGAGIAGQRLQFSIDSGAWANSEVLTNAAGYATLTITAPAAGVHTLACRFEAAGTYLAGSGSGTLTTTSLLATTTAVMDRTAGPGDAVSLSAYLQLQDKTGVAGKQLEYQFNGGSWTPASAVTEATGKASLTVTAPATAGTYVINARFLGDAAYAASTGTANLTVAAKRNAYVYTINRSGKVGAAGTLIAYFYWYQKNGTLTPVSGKFLRFVCAGVSLDGTIATDASGKATVSVTPASAGAFPFTVTFAADADYNAGGGTGTLTVAP
ncbi:MAG: SBBP repeat-containing protein [Armatimonadetes bacterium]|nr:SBBP repeat-containing protein [Armatimonadota bacterium]